MVLNPKDRRKILKAEHINPFIQSVSELFKNMLGSEIKMGIPEREILDKGNTDIIGIMALSGCVCGTIAIKFPVKTALSIAGKITGTTFKSVDSSIIDSVGELINIIAVSAKVGFNGQKITLGLPTVVRGNVGVKGKMDKKNLLAIPFTSQLGNFTLLLSFKPIENSDKEAAHACANS
jgi:chemotaxis protein CheX